MTAQQLIGMMEEMLGQTPPAGVSVGYVRGFFERNRARLVGIVQAMYDRLCRLGDLLRDHETLVGFGVLTESNSDQLAWFGRDIGSSPMSWYAVKARCHPADPFELREYAVHVRRDDEATWRLAPGEEWHADDLTAVRAFGAHHVLDAWWWSGEVESTKEAEPSGARWGHIVLQHKEAQSACREALNEAETQVEDEYHRLESRYEESEQASRNGILYRRIRARWRGYMPANVEEIEPTPPEASIWLVDLLERHLAPGTRLHSEQRERAAASAVERWVRSTFKRSWLLRSNSSSYEWYLRSSELLSDSERIQLEAVLPGIEVYVSESGSQLSFYPLFRNSETPGIRLGARMVSELTPILVKVLLDMDLPLSEEGRAVASQFGAGVPAPPSAAPVLPPAPVAAPVPPPMPSPAPVQPSAPEVAQLPPPTEDELRRATRTPWGGLMGGILPGERVQKGMRVVIWLEREHGTVLNISTSEVVWKTSAIIPTEQGVRASEPTLRTEIMYSFQVLLDDGRNVSNVSSVARELERPQVVPESIVETEEPFHRYSAAELYDMVIFAYNKYRNLIAQGERARTQASKLKSNLEAGKWLEVVEHRLPLLIAWRMRNPLIKVAKWHDALFSDLVSEFPQASIKAREINVHLTQAAVPDPGSTASNGLELRINITAQPPSSAHSAVGISAQENASGHQAGRHVTSPPSALASVSSAPPDPVSLTASIPLADAWLVSLTAHFLREGASLDRAASGKAIKLFLQKHGVQVRTRVQGGAWSGGVDLLPPGDAFSQEDRKRMKDLLGIEASRQEAAIYPFNWDERPGDLMVDDYGTPPGVWVKAEHQAELIPLLAKTHKEAKALLSQQGEAWLALIQPPAQAVASPSVAVSAGALPDSGVPRNGATTEQRQVASVGCRNVTLEVPGYGSVRVDCGAQGRRDVWHNVYVRGVRYGFNGGRWAKNLVPPLDVLRAIRAEGITAFGAEEALREPLRSVAPLLEYCRDTPSCACKTQNKAAKQFEYCREQLTCGCPPKPSSSPQLERCGEAPCAACQAFDARRAAAGQDGQASAVLEYCREPARGMS